MNRSSFAQTNLQLYAELVAAGYGEPELELGRDACELANSLFASQFRASGKPFVCHLVGTASILLPEHPPAEVLAAALLHAAYLDVETPTGRRGVTRELRESLRAISPATESMVERYATMETSAADLRAICERVDDSDSGRSLRWLVLLQVANGLEDHIDASNDACEKPIFDLQLLRELAERLAAPTLVATAEQLLEASEAPVLPELFKQPRKGAYWIVAPRPLAHRLARAARSLARRLRARLLS